MCCFSFFIFCSSFFSFSIILWSFNICLGSLSLSCRSLSVSFRGFNPSFGGFGLRDRGFGYSFRILSLGLGFRCCCCCRFLSLNFFLFDQFWFCSRCLLGLFRWEGSLWFLFLLIITIVFAVIVFIIRFHSCSLLCFGNFFLFLLRL